MDAICIFNMLEYTKKMERQEVVFLKKYRKIKKLGSLRQNFYTKFKPKECGFWDVTWLIIWRSEKD